MSDIKITCPKCSELNTISEFVESNSASCRACGEKLQIPDNLPKKAMPSFRKKETPETNPTPSSDPALMTNIAPNTQLQSWIDAKQISQQRRKREVVHTYGSWAVFVVLGTIMWYLRYKASFSGSFSFPDISRTFGPILVIAGHISIVLKAMKDSMFQGMLCLLIPFYSLYYLFSITDDFYMRSIYAGFLIGFGEDSGIIFSVWLERLSRIITNWISQGGGDIW